MYFVGLFCAISERRQPSYSPFALFLTSEYNVTLTVNKILCFPTFAKLRNSLKFSHTPRIPYLRKFRAVGPRPDSVGRPYGVARTNNRNHCGAQIHSNESRQLSRPNNYSTCCLIEELGSHPQLG